MPEVPNEHVTFLRPARHVIAEPVRFTLRREEQKRAIFCRESVVTSELQQHPLGLHVPHLHRQTEERRRRRRGGGEGKGKEGGSGMVRNAAPPYKERAKKQLRGV